MPFEIIHRNDGLLERGLSEDHLVVREFINTYLAGSQFQNLEMIEAVLKKWPEFLKLQNVKETRDNKKLTMIGKAETDEEGSGYSEEEYNDFVARINLGWSIGGPFVVGLVKEVE